MIENCSKTTLTTVRRILRTVPLLVPWALLSQPARADSIIFQDNFSGPSLNPAWQVSAGQGADSVGNGQLTYYNQGPQASTTGWYSAALTLEVPFYGTNWEIQTEAAYNLYALDSGGNSSGAQAPEVLVAFAPGMITSGSGGPNYAGSDYAVIERDEDYYYGANTLVVSYGAATTANLINPADATLQNNIAGGTYWYLITRNGGTLTIDVSYGGATYFTALSTELADPSSSYNELLLGGATWETVGSFTNYGPTEITALSSTPEPRTLILSALGLFAFSARRFSRAKKSGNG